MIANIILFFLHSPFLSLFSYFAASIVAWCRVKAEKQTGFLFGKLYSIRPYQLTLPYIKNNYIYLFFLCLYQLINLVLFVSRAIQYGQYNYYVIIARACGKCAFFIQQVFFVFCPRSSSHFLRRLITARQLSQNRAQCDRLAVATRQANVQLSEPHLLGFIHTFFSLAGQCLNFNCAFVLVLKIADPNTFLSRSKL